MIHGCPVFMHKFLVMAADGSMGVDVVCDHRVSWVVLPQGITTLVLAKVDQWVSDIHHLSNMAESQPQAVYGVLTKSLQCE